MDAKDLQAVQRCRSAKKSIREKPSQHVPGQGFSAESEKFFADAAAQKREAIDSQIASASPYKADHELDEVTRELRSEFTLLNKIFELREVAKQRSNKESSDQRSKTSC